MFNRRKLLVALGLVPASGFAISNASAEAQLCEAAQQLGFRMPPQKLDISALSAGVSVEPLRTKEVAQALQILFSTPGDGRPISIAGALARLEAKNNDSEKYLYREEWPLKKRANPLICSFWGTTLSFPPKGDQTAWCAAFMNYCLVRSGYVGTDSGSSGSFRSLIDKPVDSGKEPETGDITVFRIAGADGDLGQGHVGFYVSPNDASSDPNEAGKFWVQPQTKAAWSSERIFVLGGNQAGGVPGSTGGIKVSVFNKEPSSDDDLRLLGYVSIGSLEKTPPLFAG